MPEEQDMQMSVLPQAVIDEAAAFTREMMLYEAAAEAVTAKLHVLVNEFRLGRDRSPIDNIQSRIKSIGSIREKMERKGLPISTATITANVLDIAGVRVVCPFLSDVYDVARMLLRQGDVHLVKMKDYITNPKPSGYRSLHLIVTVEVNLSTERRRVPVELQLRTIAMNCWASVEHQLRYKKNREMTEQMTAELKECAQLMSLMDEKVQGMADSLGDFIRDDSPYV